MGISGIDRHLGDVLSSECINVPRVAQKTAIVCRFAMPQLVVGIQPPGINRPRGRRDQAVVGTAGHLHRSPNNMSMLVIYQAS